ncbi:MAG: O-antigen ligase family protein [Bacilli bacterium]|nr:O-antigen ligase family protein [Bacilli bacterium]
MEQWMKKNISKVIAIFILLQPILDLLTGVCVNTLHWNITIGIIIRILFLIFICITVLFIFKKKKLLIPYLLIGLYFILYTIGELIYKDSSILTEIQNLVRAFYFPILLISLYSIREHIRISNMTFLTTVLLYTLLIFIPTILGIGYKSYQITKAGTLGFFNSANEISGIFSILTPILFVIFYKSKKWIPITMISFVYLVVILMIGTKTPFLTLFITLGISVLYLWSYFIKEKKYKQIGVSLGVILLACMTLLLVIPKTNFYKNIKTHLNYLGLNHVTEVFQDKDLVDHFIFSSRLKFMRNKASIYMQSSTYEKIFGIGYINNNKNTKQIEMDYFDIFYSHGILGFIIYFGVVLYVLYFILDNRKQIGFENGMRSLSFFLIIFLSFMTGHIITAPSVSMIVVILILSLEKRKKKDLLFASFNLDIGGIEKALLNLVNAIDKKKYNVTVILEEKKGIFLDQINKNVRVEECKVSNCKNVVIRKSINLARKLWFKILNDHNYDFSCCYATYSYSSGKLACIASDNTSIYVHSNFTIVYPKVEDFFEYFESRNIKNYKHIIFVSNESKDAFLTRYKDLEDKCLVFNNFVNILEIKKQSEEEIELKKDPKKKVLLFVGRLEDASKKLLRQINLVKEIPELELWIVGDGPDRRMYEKEVELNNLEDRITFFGKKQNPFPYMKKADYVILTSDYEGFPVTYLEAIILGKSIITTIPTSDESIDISKIGYVISKEETEMVKEVKQIISKPDKKQKINLEEVQVKRMNQLYELFNE